MIPLDGQPILTASEMRAAEDAAVAAGTNVDTLMQRAGEGVAIAVHRLAAGADILILCGPGNNGGDGYVAAAALQSMGARVRVAASGPAKTEVAARAAAGWGGPVETLAQAEPATILVDALFGTGLSRPLADEIAAPLHRLARAARLRIAVDMPSGVGTDDGAMLGAAMCDITLALGAAKPAHLLQPAAQACGTVRLLMLGISTISYVHVLSSPLPSG
ncbi:NAD(P)H-hydrate epimerase, partial [Sphingomonas sp.]|uniref:NAD(P)H-hydrate epimerase n=1 Tax=Sphingomonas sp. TaxID=28214 RepID=UPI0035B1C0DD